MKTPSDERTLGDVIRAALPVAPLQLLVENVTGAVERKKLRATAITFLTQNCTPGEILNPETARYVAVVVWVPMAIYRGESESDN